MFDDDSDNDQCNEYFLIMQTMAEIFLTHFHNYMKTDITTISKDHNYNQVIHVEVVKNLTDTQHNIEIISKNLTQKLDLYMPYINKCIVKEHLKLRQNLLYLHDTFLNLNEQFKKKKDENFKNLQSIQFINCVSDENKLVIVDNYNNPVDNYSSYSNYDDNLFHSQSQAMLLLEEEINRQKEYQNDKENEYKIKQLKEQINSYIKTCSKEVQKSNEQLIIIDNEIENTQGNVEKTNEQLRQAAIYKNKQNFIKLPFYLGTGLGVVGSVVPVVGNIVGAAIGSSLGYGIAKLEKKAIENIEPEKYKK